MHAAPGFDSRASSKESTMKRIASVVAAVALGMLPVVGSAGAATAAPAPTPKTDVSAQDCGLSVPAQSYTNCRGHPHWVSIAYFDSIDKSGGSVLSCVQPGTIPTINLIGPGRLAINSFENGSPC